MNRAIEMITITTSGITMDRTRVGSGCLGVGLLSVLGMLKGVESLELMFVLVLSIPRLTSLLGATCLWTCVRVESFGEGGKVWCEMRWGDEVV